MVRRSRAKGIDRLQASLFEPPPPPTADPIPPPPAGNEILAATRRPEHSRSYRQLYSVLCELREEFHRIGRFDDANAKLDEICKLLALKTLDQRHLPSGAESRLSLAYLSKVAQSNFGSPHRLAAALHHVYDEIVAVAHHDLNVFGARPSLDMETDDDAFAQAIIPLIEKLPVIEREPDSEWSFDRINEVFGHFVQDSFRNRKEDAQYMTPPEVVSAMVDLALTDLGRKDWQQSVPSEFVVCDPTCGVGSFLAAVYRRTCGLRKYGQHLAKHILLIGQDKVDRMVRLSNINLRIFADASAQILNGNSILPPSGIDEYAGRIALILTNPPFGATFESASILRASSPNQYPVMFELASAGLLPKCVDSEYLLLDRELALLEPGGRLLMIVPDRLVSGAGFARVFRLAIGRRAQLAGVLDLPVETFAQAGTRTKTSIVYLRRGRADIERNGRRSVFMAACDDIGFRVVERAGATVKRISGSADLARIVQSYEQFDEAVVPSAPFECLMLRPAVAVVASDRLLNESWTAGFYRPERLLALRQIIELKRQGFIRKPLAEVVEIEPGEADRVVAGPGNRCISVLHVLHDGCLDLNAVDSYEPKTPCVQCQPGDVLLSKINPRIPRICVVPDLGCAFGCSSEFAVLRSKDKDFTPEMLCLLLQTECVQAQIRSLTSGTSSSHNRIKTRELGAVIVPYPKKESSAYKELAAIARQYAGALRKRYASSWQILKCGQSARDLLNEQEGYPKT